ncbi:MAG: hypothetical protein RMX68_011315 [Aulosira sp. ZfuVER01]|nr:hypothetical protein [Aulosira sp. ZfuVER01]MDZ7996938.1 hypothetical protein [Aulosira sp. DedVER01a]MDZ8050558.1 hypothetical protein [Aulosira sp. ZfuCHP01]
MEQKVFFIGPTYLSIESVFNSPDAYGNEFKPPDSWEDQGEVIAWGYRISSSEVYFHSQIDYLSSNKLEYIHLCQYVCDRMAELLDSCIAKIEKQNINLDNKLIKLADFSFRVYHFCEYLSLDQEYGLSLKLNQLVKSGKLKQTSTKGGLSEKVSQFKHVDFSAGGGSKTLSGAIRRMKSGFFRDIKQNDLRNYPDYLLFKQRRHNDFNQLDELVL